MVNKVILIGNIGADPETRKTASDASVTNARLATTEYFKNKTTGEREDRTEWHTLVAFNNKVFEQYIKKGSKVYVEGKLQTRKWTDKDGNDRYSTEIVVSDVQMLDKKDSASPSAHNVAKQDGYQPSHDLQDEIPF